MLKKLPLLLFAMQPRASLASFLCAVTMASAAQGADCVRVVSPAGRPILSEKDVPVQMSGYSPRFWDNTSRIHAHLDCFNSHKLGYVFSGTPGWRATSWFWGEGESVQTEPDYHGTNSTKFAHFDENVLVTVSNMPNARLIIRFGLDEAGIFEPESPWRKAHPDDMVLTETGKRLNVPSLASDLFWGKTARSAGALAKWYERQPYAGRIVAYANFWRMEGTHEATMMGWLSDRSPVMTHAWRAYLKETYGDDARLQAAWGETNATIEAALPPADRLRGPVREVAALPYWQTGPANAQFRDWLLCLRGLFHRRVREVAAAMQDGCGGRVPCIHDMLKQPMQGWNILEFFNPNEPSQPFSLELMSACGSSAVSKLLDAPGVDGLITPHDYQGRGMGGIFEPEGVADSCTLRGKLFLCEMDTRSYAGNFTGDESAPARNLAEFEAITWRNIATGISRGWWPYWMDLYADWFSDPAMQPIIKRQAVVLNEATLWPHHDEPGIAIVIDDAATEETSGAGRLPYLAISEQLRLGIGRCGVPYRLYLLEDLARTNLPAHKVWYFPNLFRFDARRQALVKRIQCNGHVIVWGPGTAISDGQTIGVTSASKMTGFSFKLLPVNYHRRGLFLGGHALTEGIAGQPFGDGIGYGPQLYPTNGFSLASAWTQQAKNLSALSVLPQTGWTSVFTAALPLPAGFWRNAARLANAHVWCESDDVLVASREIVALHSVIPGDKVIRLPRPCRVMDLTTGTELSPSTDQLRFTLDTPGTRVFRLLEPAEATNRAPLSRTASLITAHKPVSLVLLGDSISELKAGWNGGATQPQKNWGALLTQKLQEAYSDTRFSVHHFGVGGENTRESLARLDTLAPVKPDLVLVAFGANDCCHHFLEPKETQEALAQLIAQIRKRFNADVVVLGTGGDNPLKPFFRHLEETLQAQREAACAASAPFVDVRAAILSATHEGRIWAEYHLNEGNCHPNDKGHIVWAEACYTLIKERVP